MLPTNNISLLIMVVQKLPLLNLSLGKDEKLPLMDLSLKQITLLYISLG